MKPEDVKSYFCKAPVVEDYARAVDEVGLWNSERAMVSKYFNPDDAILELGCGAGRISINLALAGFSNLTATDFSPAMVDAARKIAESKNLSGIKFAVCDAVSIGFGDGSFGGAVFGFNGLMQIPRRQNRRKALREIARILKPRSRFLFTTHDRDNIKNKQYWENEKKQWLSNSQMPVLDDFGDIYYRGDHGNIFIHSPVRSEIEDDLQAAGFVLLECSLRSIIAQEPPAVVDFSDDCLFWAAEKY